METAAAWVEFFGVLATVIAIAAAYVELRTVLPAQALTVEVARGTSTTWVVLRNEDGSPLVNAYRIVVSPARDLGHGELSHLDESGFPLLHYDGPGPDREEWAVEVYRWGDELSAAWALQENAPFFPGSTVYGPTYRVTGAATHWRVTWWTDREGPREIALRIPAEPDYRDALL